ncbi:MAG: HAMP domain-containing histidine kinase [Clostridia bacterium]|nr:HAMP domain-containing histidine kinase [Clostridia bacterium]
MKFKNFFKDKIITTTLLLFAILAIEIFLIAYPIANFIKIYIPIIIIGLYAVGITIEYLIKKQFYTNLIMTLEELEDKYLITEIIKSPNFIEGKILNNSLQQINKSMIENVNKYKYMLEDYKEYIELWIHEIKMPIATSKMVIENNKNEVTKSIDEELEKIENYIEQALFYARSSTVEKDYYIKKTSLQDIVNESIKKNKNILIAQKISLNIHNIEEEVNTDSKWIVFILNQIIQNSVKYMKSEELSQIEIYAKQAKENVILYIKDNGIGIKKGEITRVFEKGFTGTNGREANKKSTGIGLYLCKKLCDKLGISIELNSVQNEGTEVRLVFPKGSYVEIA